MKKIISKIFDRKKLPKTIPNIKNLEDKNLCESIRNKTSFQCSF